MTEEIQQAIVTQGSRPGLDPLLRHAATKLLSLAQLPPGSHVIVEADEALTALPFTLLINRDGPAATAHAISYVPSAGIFRNLRALRTESGNSGYIAFGRTDFGTENAPLPGVAREITAASMLFGRDVVYSNPEARESDIYAHANDLAKVKLLHLATHTDIRDGETALLFREGDGEDGRLTETDILTRFRTSADLVILSGCDTATLDRQGDVPGEAFSALTRAFFAAGAKRLLVTQWPIRDDFAAPFIAAFAKSYTSGKGPARALADAQLAVRALPDATEWDWAGWILVGD